MNMLAQGVAGLARGLATWPRPVAVVVLTVVRLVLAVLGVAVLCGVVAVGAIAGSVLIGRRLLLGPRASASGAGAAAGWPLRFRVDRAGRPAPSAARGDVVDVQAREVAPHDARVGPTSPLR